MNAARPAVQLLCVVVREQHPFMGDSVDVWRAIAHHSHVVGAYIEPANVVTEDHQYVWLLLLLCVR